MICCLNELHYGISTLSRNFDNCPTSFVRQHIRPAQRLLDITFVVMRIEALVGKYHVGVYTIVEEIKKKANSSGTKS